MTRLFGPGLLAALLFGSPVWVDAEVPAAKDAAERLEQSPRHHEWVELEVNGRKVKTFVVFPEVDKPAPAVVVIHENRGLNAWARSLADQLAEAGYVAIAPDLLSGSGPDGGATDSFKSEDDARNAIYELDAKQTLADLGGAVNYAKKLPAANGQAAVVGFCWGGGQAFRAATLPGVDLACVFYGGAPDEETLKQAQAPIYGFYGGNDFRITGAVPEVAETMKKLDKKFEPVTYDKAGHGFMRSGEADDADKANVEGRAAAWQRLQKTLDALK